MKIVIIGCGKIGKTIIKSLAQEGHDITALDTNEEVLKRLAGTYDILTLQEKGISVESQIQAGVGDADLLIAATSSDEKNILCCMTAKKLGAKQTIARVRDPEYADYLTLLKDELSLSYTVNPDYALGDEIAKLLKYPSAISVDTFADGKLELAETRVNDLSLMKGLTLRETAQKMQTPFLICAVARDGELIIPKGDFVFKAGDVLSVADYKDMLDEFFKEVGVYKTKPKKIMIIGGGPVTYRLVGKLKRVGIQIKVIEIDKEKAEEMQRKIDYVSVIHGDARSETLLNEEGIDDTDAFIALTGADDTNSILSLYAKQKGVKKVITKINHKLVGGMFEQIGLDSIVSTENVTANNVVKIVRGMTSKKGEELISLYKMFNGQGEAAEFKIPVGSKFSGKQIKDLPIKKDALIVSVLHDGELILASGGTELFEGDSVVVIGKHLYFDTLDDIIE